MGVADDFYVEDGEGREEDNLEERVKCYENGAVIAVSLGQIRPDQDHGNTSCDANENQSFSKVLPVWEEGPCEADHEERSNDPIQDERYKDLGPEGSFLEEEVESFEADFAEDRVHHYKEADSYWNADTHELPFL